LTAVEGSRVLESACGSGPYAMCALLVGLPAVTVLGVEDVAGEPTAVHVERVAGRWWCTGCGCRAWVQGSSRGGAGGRAVLRPAVPADLAQAPLLVPGAGVRERVLDRRGPGGVGYR
jgi:hypothetical protein